MLAYGIISGWDVSGINSMNSLFKNKTTFNGNISTWDTSNVIDMSEMFHGAVNFDQNIGSWDVSNVTTMSQMFQGATVFNQNIGNWTTTSLENMNATFQDAISFDQPIGNWNVSSVTNMTDTFNAATSFNSPLTNWDTSSVVQMNGMFANAVNFDQDISNFNVENCTNWTNFATNVSFSKSNYESILTTWATQNITSSTGAIDFGNSTSGVVGGAAIAALAAMGISVSDNGGTTSNTKIRITHRLDAVRTSGRFRYLLLKGNNVSALNIREIQVWVNNQNVASVNNGASQAEFRGGASGVDEYASQDIPAWTSDGTTYWAYYTCLLYTSPSPRDS